MDDPDCDSTWEDAEEEEEEEEEEEDGDGPSSAGDDDGEAGAPGDAGDAEDEDEEARPGLLQSRMTVSRNWRAMRDTCRYRHHYPDLTERDGNGDMPNLSFYRNEIRFLPNGCFIEDILQNWREDYDLLEDNHSYIQWLFPLRELGVNWHAKPLTQREIEAFKSCKEASARFVQAYELMLGFYGIELEDRDTGRVRRAQNYRKRFQNLNWHSHNNLRITRILKSLGELGLERYQAPLVRFFLEETLVRRELLGVRQSALDYFVFTVRCRRQRRALLRFAWEHFRPRSKFVWGPPGRLRRLRLRSPPRAPAQAGPRLAEGKESPGDPLPEGGDCVTAEPQLLSDEPQEKGTREKEAQERDRGEEVGSQGEEGPESSSPQESKKRKLEVNLREQAQGEPGSQSASEVEKIALNLEGCALSQGSLGAGTQEMGSQDPGETEQPCAPSPEAREADDEVRKRRKVDQMPAPSEGPEAGVRENGKQEGQAGGQGSPEQGAPRSAAPAEPAPEEKAEPAEAVLEAKPQTP